MSEKKSRRSKRIKKPKSVLGKHVYVVERRGDGNRFVHKVPNDGELPQVYEIDPDGVCSCRAGDFGGDCKHGAMADGSLEGNELTKRRATSLLEEYFDKIRNEWPKVRTSSLMSSISDKKIKVAVAMVHGAPHKTQADYLTIWTEFSGLLICLHTFKDYQRYRSAVRKARHKYSNYTPPNDLGKQGKSYGTG